MRLRFLVARGVPDEPSRIVNDATVILRRRGFEVSTLIAEDSPLPPDRLGKEADLWLLKSHTLVSLSLAGSLYASGARVINRYAACLAVRNKITADRVLHTASVPTPASWVTNDLTLLIPFVRLHPLVVKPRLGSGGMRVVRDEAELLALPRPREPVLVQAHIPSSGEDLRVYVAGERIFATRQSLSPAGEPVPGRLVPVTDEVRHIARRCGEAFGLGLFGLDLIETEDGPRVVDVSYFPSYRGIPAAAEAVASYIAGCADSLASAAPAVRAAR
jgi:ribosomal protein S6--L-glutamate ligase